MIVGCISSESRSSPGSLYEPPQILVCGGFRALKPIKKPGADLMHASGSQGSSLLSLKFRLRHACIAAGFDDGSPFAVGNFHSVGFTVRCADAFDFARHQNRVFGIGLRRGLDIVDHGVHLFLHPGEIAKRSRVNYERGHVVDDRTVARVLVSNRAALGEQAGKEFAGKAESGAFGGVDKGLELFRGRPLIEAVIDRLKPQCVSIVISANRNLERYAAWGYPVVRDLDDAFAGPLAALAAAGAQSVVMTEWVLTAPCDAPFFPEDLMERFRMAQERSLQEGRDPDAFIAKGERPQNAFACLRSKCLLSAGSFLALGRRRLGWWYSELHAETVQMPDESAFANLNTLDELKAAE